MRFRPPPLPEPMPSARAKLNSYDIAVRVDFVKELESMCGDKAQAKLTVTFEFLESMAKGEVPEVDD